MAKKKPQLKVEYVPIGKLKPFKGNPRKNEAAVSEIVRSIEHYGYTSPILVRRANNEVIAGHTRLLALKETGAKKVPVIYLDMTPKQAHAYGIFDNKSTENTEWNVPKLTDLIEQLTADGIEWDNLGFTEAELAEMQPVMDVEPDPKDDVVPDPPKKPKTKAGDLYLLGEHRLLCGDATKAEDVERIMGGEKAALCFTSPPYSNMRDYGGGNLSVDHLAKFLGAAVDQCRLFVVNLGLQRKDGRIFSYWDQYISAAESVGLPLTAWNVWSKRGMGGSIANMSAMFPIEHEWLFVFGGCKDDVRRTKKNKSTGLYTGISNRQRDGTTQKTSPKIVKAYGRLGSVFEVCYGRHKDHPAAYPVALPAAYVAACSDPHAIVYDPFLGSGTTLIAAEKLNRKCYGLEIDPGYCDVIVKRWEDFTGKKANRMRAKRAS